MKRIMQDIRKPKSAPRVWRFRKKVPERILLFVAPPATVFSPWTKHLGFAVAFLLGPALAFSVSTNAAFTDADPLSSQKIGTGEWIPDIRLDEHDDCVKLSSSLPGAKIYYKFSDDGDPRTNGTIFDGECVKIPKGKKKSLLQARAFHPKYDHWRSDILEKSFSNEKDRSRDEDDDDCDTRKEDEEEEEGDFAEGKQASGMNERDDEGERADEGDATLDPSVSDESAERAAGIIDAPIVEENDEEAEPSVEPDGFQIEESSSSDENS